MVEQKILELDLDFDAADTFISKKPDWCRSDQTRENAATLIAAAKAARALNMLEIGTSAGEGAAALLEGSAAAGSHLVGIDIAKSVYYDKSKLVGSVVVDHFPQHADRYSLHIGLTSRTVRVLNKKFDLVHIDGQHSHPWAVLDFLNVLPMLNEGALVLFDDANYTAPLSQGAYYFSRNLKSGFFVHGHFVLQYEGITDALFESICDTLKLPWQTKLETMYLTGLFDSLREVFQERQAMMITGLMMESNADFIKQLHIFKDLNDAQWQLELERRRLVHGSNWPKRS